jgi:hypothetical protein
VGADAGLSHFGQGPIGQGPERGQFVKERLMAGKSLGFGHYLCILYRIHPVKQKGKIFVADPFATVPPAPYRRRT